MPYVGKTPVVGNFVKLDAIVTSATATYNLLNGGVAYFPQTANNCIVSLNGVIQSPTSAYTISGSTIVFDSALTSADSIDFILVLGDVLSIGTPSDGTVTNAKIAASTIDLTTKVTGTLPYTNGGTGLAALGTSLQVLRTNTGATALEFATPTSGKFESALLHVRDEKASGSAGGTATSGSFFTRTLNTSVTNEISGASLASNQITLPSGTYFIYASAPGYGTNRIKTKLRNITDSTDTLIGSGTYTDSVSAVAEVKSFIAGRFTISAQKTFEIQQRVQTTFADANALGIQMGFSVAEIYTDVQIWKIA